MTSPDINDNPLSASQARFTFRKGEHLCKKSHFELLFREGSTIKAKLIGSRFLLMPENQDLNFPVKVAFAVPKRNFRKAHERNLLKRRMREAYRLHKAELFKHLKENKKQLLLLLRYNQRKVRPYTFIEAAIREQIQNIAVHVQNPK